MSTRAGQLHIVLERFPASAVSPERKLGRYFLAARAHCAFRLGMSSQARRDRKRLYAYSPGDPVLSLVEDAERGSEASGSSRNSPADLMGLSPSQFEEVCARTFEAEGASVVRTQAARDGGVDLIVADHSGKIAVQCKRQSARVGIKPLRELVGALGPLQLRRAAFVTTSTYTAEAEAFAASNKIALLDGTALAARLRAAGMWGSRGDQARGALTIPDLEMYRRARIRDGTIG